MNRRLQSLHARTICHETEDRARVESALRTVVGDAPVKAFRSEGHFGNSIILLESDMEDERQMMDVLRRMTDEDFDALSSQLDARVDESCNLFLRFDKQAAYAGELRLCGGDDVVAVRIKVLAFPAKRALAVEVARGVLEEADESRRARSP